jgi:TolB-like protein/Tfp pilus assembly protein PilF/predicted Ser/Thr protein kinase
MVAQTLGHYRILEKLGEGKWGVVYRAHDERLDRSVALKVLSSGTLADESTRKSFRQEALTLAKFNHPNIEGIFDFDSQDGVDFLVMEYVDGGTLASRIKARSLSEKDIARLGAQIAEALDDAHDRGIIHRDLKPNNIAVTSKGQLKVLDFGLAKLFDPSLGPIKAETLTQSTDGEHVVGTLPYMAPEQVLGEHIDPRTDVYGLGAVLYEMATSERPFRDCSVARLFDSIIHQTPMSPRALNPRLSMDMERIILKCLEKDPAQRYQSIKEVGVDLRSIGPRAVSGVLPSVTAPFLARNWRKWLMAPILGLVVAALATVSFGSRVGGMWTHLWGHAPTAQIQAIAVLPLADLSHDQDQEYFVDGMTDELIKDLAQIRALRVISRTSAMRYKGTNKTLPQIARELHVDAVVEGSVLRDGSNLRVTTQLVYASTDTQLWGESYHRDLSNSLWVQDEVARAIANEIKVKLTPEERGRFAKPQQTSFEVHDAYLKGRFHLRRGTEDQMREARMYFDEAIKIDPNYAPAYTGLADYYWLTNELPPGVAMPKAKAYVEKALALDGGLADAHATLASINFYGDWDWIAADKEFKRAIELSPGDAEFHRNYSDFLSEMGRHEQALVEVGIAQELDPLSSTTNLAVGWVFYYARQYDHALEQCRKVLDLDPHFVSAHECLASTYLAKGAYDQALTEYQDLASSSQNDPVRLAGLGCANALAGKKLQARKIIAQLDAASKSQYVAPYFVGVVHASLGEKDQAFSWLGKAFAERDSYLVRLKVEPGLDSLRSDPRFEKLLLRMNLKPS